MRWAQRFAALRTGPALADLDCGPLIRASQRDRVRTSCTGAPRRHRRRSARAHRRRRAVGTASTVAPTLLRDVPAGHRLACEEVFGPVLSAMPFDGRGGGTAPRQCAPTSVSWPACGRATAAASCAWRARSGAGQVFVNNYGAGGGVELPFGGVEALGPRPRKGVRGAVRVHDAEDRGHPARVTRSQHSRSLRCRALHAYPRSAVAAIRDIATQPQRFRCARPVGRRRVACFLTRSSGVCWVHERRPFRARRASNGFAMHPRFAALDPPPQRARRVSRFARRRVVQRRRGSALRSGQRDPRSRDRGCADPALLEPGRERRRLERSDSREPAAATFDLGAVRHAGRSRVDQLPSHGRAKLATAAA